MYRFETIATRDQFNKIFTKLDYQPIGNIVFKNSNTPYSKEFVFRRFNPRIKGYGGYEVKQSTMIDPISTNNNKPVKFIVADDPDPILIGWVRSYYDPTKPQVPGEIRPWVYMFMLQMGHMDDMVKQLFYKQTKDIDLNISELYDLL